MSQKTSAKALLEKWLSTVGGRIYHRVGAGVFDVVVPIGQDRVYAMLSHCPNNDKWAITHNMWPGKESDLYRFETPETAFSWWKQLPGVLH